MSAPTIVLEVHSVASRMRPRAVLGPGRARLDRVAAGAGQAAERDEAKAACAQARDRAFQGAQGDGGIRPRVVQAHDPSLGAGGRDGAHDLLGRAAAPVAAVEVGERDQRAAAGGTGQCGRLPGAHTLWGGGAGRADEPGADAGGAGDRGFRQIELGARGPRRQPREIDVGEGVVAQTEAVAVKITHDLGMARDPRAHEEERGGHAVPAQQRREPRGPDGVRAVVEGERDLYGPEDSRCGQPAPGVTTGPPLETASGTLPADALAGAESSPIPARWCMYPCTARAIPSANRTAMRTNQWALTLTGTAFSPGDAHSRLRRGGWPRGLARSRPAQPWCRFLPCGRGCSNGRSRGRGLNLILLTCPVTGSAAGAGAGAGTAPGAPVRAAEHRPPGAGRIGEQGPGGGGGRSGALTAAGRGR